MSFDNGSGLFTEYTTDYPRFNIKDYSKEIQIGLAGLVLLTAIVAILLFILCLHYRRKFKIQQRMAQSGGGIPLERLNTAVRQSEYEEQSYQYARFKHGISNRKAISSTGSSNGLDQQEHLYYNMERVYNGSTHTEPFYYMIPEADEDALYDQLRQFQISYLKLENILLGQKIGSGQFGEVCRGTWISPRGKVEVAVKTLKKGASGQDKVKFLQEVAIMAQFKHPSVVTMYGVMTMEEPFLLVLELMEGDLRQHLQTSWSKCHDESVKRHAFLSYCRQVVHGMTYLANKQFIHRDIAARNILVSGQNTCKIGDFGMSRDLMQGEYYVSQGGFIPVKWTAPEAIFYKKYSTASDVWSYGVLLFEIWSVGCKPYEQLSNNQVISALKSGFRLTPPPGCPRAIYRIMMDCWHPDPIMRPSFESLTQSLSQSDLELLQWTLQDKKTHQKANTLGAKLTVAKELYPDLQSTYLGSSFTLQGHMKL